MQWVKASERLPEVSPEDETIKRFIVDGRNEEGYGKIWFMTYHDLKDLTYHDRTIQWLDESFSHATAEVKSREEILKEEYGKLIANPEKVYLQNPSIIKAAHSAMSIYASQQTSELKAEVETFKDAYVERNNAYNKVIEKLLAIHTLAFADHSSVEYNMEEIRKILNNQK